jgi:ABC-type oligopeptide transport system ATPase subunit
MKLKLSDDFIIDTDDERVQKQGLRIAIIGESGSGKSWTIAVLAEQAKMQGVQVVFIDPHGEYHTFAKVFEDLIVVGGENADLPLYEDAIDVYSEAYRMGKSLDFNLREVFTDEYEYGRIVEKILRSLWKVQVNDPRPAIWCLEEAHLECPQEKSHDAMRRVGLVKAIATGGRKFGVSLVLGTQRPAELNKTPLSQCWIRLFGKLTDKLDREAVADYMKPVDPRELMKLATGQFYVFGWFSNPLMVRIRSDRITEHGAETILIKPIERKAVKEKASIEQLRKMLEERMKKIEQEKTQLGILQQELNKAKREKEELAKEIERLKAALEVAGTLKLDIKTPPTPEKVVEKVGVDPEDVKRFVKELRDGLLETFDKVAERFLGKEETVKPSGALNDDVVKMWLDKLPTPCAKKIFTFLAEHRGVKFTKSQIALQTAYSSNSGTFNSALSLLKRNNLVKTDGESWWFE